MSYKDLYSEVKKMKQQGSKKDVVKAVEKHGRILAVEGRFEKPKKVINNMYGQVRLTIKPPQVPKYDLSNYDLVLLGCPADKIPESSHPKIRNFVENGGFVKITSNLRFSFKILFFNSFISFFLSYERLLSYLKLLSSVSKQ